MAAISTRAVPTLFTSKFCDSPRAPMATGPHLSDGEDTLIAVAMPCKATTCGEALSEAVMVTCSSSAPILVGTNNTFKLQLASGATAPPLEHCDCTGAMRKSGGTAMLAIVRAAVSL